MDTALAEHNELFSVARLVRGQDSRPNQRQKTDDLRPVTFVTLNTRLGKPKPVQVTALLDSGGSGCLLDPKFTKNLRVRTDKNQSVVWSTPAGNLTTNKVCKAKMVLTELIPDKTLEWKIHVAPGSLGNYDMIIGRDLLDDLGIDFRFSDHTVICDGAEIPFRSLTERLKTLLVSLMYFATGIC